MHVGMVYRNVGFGCRYLAGVAALSCEPVDRESAALHLERAREMMEQLRQKDPSVICNGVSEQQFLISLNTS